MVSRTLFFPVTIETIFAGRRHRADTGRAQIGSHAAHRAARRDEMIERINRKKARLRLALFAAVALGSSSASLSGVLGSLALHPIQSEAQLV
jgi:hypothetical protein